MADHTLTRVPQDIYPRAAEVIRTLGWSQGRFITEEADKPLERSPVCVIEALCRGAGLAPKAWCRLPSEHLVEVMAAIEVLALQLGDDPNDPEASAIERLIRWNDAAERTVPDVLALLDAAANRP
ncbi:hypothetical protein GCM10010156_49290 [Planobispora rosea]|uniref:Uncharacterized protein n=1 Tax=Planobispora rosea TaxID=35762 RepID=A0A8J3S5D8_PLARO|nr:hypothetical protein [Planobispora rosea]GGS84809.1 hypothetical protein GCM10010156_49290 [Planobispora rosea]GIH86440.1 hypothetical protein Pro02_48480 [Planobispora rosea]